jgi:type I restriction enzyme S subunit
MKGASKIQAKQILNLDWLNTIPSGWSLTKLKSIYTPKKEYSDKEEELLSVYRDFGVIPKSSRDDNFNRASEDLSKYILIQPDDLVINKMKAWQGSIAISKYRGIVSPAYFTYKPNIDTKTKFFLPYLHHLLRSPLFVEVYKRISNGIRPQQWDLDPYLFSTLPIPMPPIDTQKVLEISGDFQVYEK